jgi:hypothetical protein
MIRTPRSRKLLHTLGLWRMCAVCCVLCAVCCVLCACVHVCMCAVCCARCAVCCVLCAAQLKVPSALCTLFKCVRSHGACPLIRASVSLFSSFVQCPTVKRPPRPSITTGTGYKGACSVAGLPTKVRVKVGPSLRVVPCPCPCPCPCGC